MRSMGGWYALQAPLKQEEKAAGLLRHAIKGELYSCCCIPKRNRVFRSGGMLHVLEDVMFPGYVFVKTDCPDAMAGELWKASAFPQFLSFEIRKKKSGYREIRGSISIQELKYHHGMFSDPVPLEEQDMAFLQDVCGESLQSVMGISRITLNSKNQIIQADGVLERYLDRIIKLNLHKRFAIVEAPLFNRTQPVLFGICLKQDQAARGLRSSVQKREADFSAPSGRMER